MPLRGATPLVDFLAEAARELGFGAVSVRSELRLAAVGQPDLQVVDGTGTAIGYGETKTPGLGTRFAEVLESEQVGRYRATLENLLVTDFLRFTVLRPDLGRLDVTLVETPGRLAAGSMAVSAPALAQLDQVLSAFFSARSPSATPPHRSGCSSRRSRPSELRSRSSPLSIDALTPSSPRRSRWSRTTDLRRGGVSAAEQIAEKTGSTTLQFGRSFLTEDQTDG